jgi:tRNA A-37 threonylcarbamoyl transferase component Bud32
VSALEAARALVGSGPIGTFDILVSLIAVDTRNDWAAVQLRSAFVDPAESDRFGDPDGATGAGQWRGTPLTAVAYGALRDAVALGTGYGLLPLPAAVVALGLVRDPRTGAARALLTESDVDPTELLRLIEDELLDTHLEGLGPVARPAAAPAGADAPTRPPGGGPKVPPPGATDLPPVDPTVANLLEGARSLGRAEDSGAWTLIRGNRELRLYDLREKSEAERRMIEAEASVATSLGDLPAVATVLRVWEEGGWLIVETPALGKSLEDHLVSSGRGEESRWAAEDYARALDEVAKTLNTVHERGLVHLNLKPTNLRLDPDVKRLVLTDFAIAGLGQGESDDRYRAPECFAGERGPSVDQYALGVIARDVFAAPAAPPLTTPLRTAIRRATAPDPSDRFPTIDQFGQELQRAAHSEAPRGLAERLARRSPAFRAALTPAAIAAVLTSAITVAMAPGSGEKPDVMLLTSPLLLGLVASFTFLGILLAGKLRGQRRVASLSLASRPAVPFLAFVVLMLLAHPPLGDSETPGVLFRSLIVAYGGCALLAPARPDAGRRFVGILSYWDRRRALPPGRRRLLTGTLALGAVAVLTIPAIVGAIWREYDYPTYVARGLTPLWAVWNFRVELDHGEYHRLCRQVLTPTAAGDSRHCARLARYAAAVQASDPATNRGPESFGMKGTIDTFVVQQIPAATGVDLWDLLTPTMRLAGTIYTEGRDHRHLIAMISRERPKARSDELHSVWLYRVAWSGGGWKVDEYRACDLSPPGSGQKPADCDVTSSSTLHPAA